MAVIVGKTDNGLPVYRSVKGFDINEDDRREADRIDSLLHKELKGIFIRHKDTKSIGEKNVVYWEIGHVLRSIFTDSKLPVTEFQYFIINASNQMPDELRTKQRSANRNPIVYCYRLGGLSIDLVKRLKWSEWSHLFDQPGINREQRFDTWLADNIVTSAHLFDRVGARLMTKCISAMLSKIETSDLSDDELTRSYDAALAITDTVLEYEQTGKVGEDINLFGRKIQAHIKNRVDLFVQLIEGSINPARYADQILG